MYLRLEHLNLLEEGFICRVCRRNVISSTQATLTLLPDDYITACASRKG